MMMEALSIQLAGSTYPLIRHSSENLVESTRAFVNVRMVAYGEMQPDFRIQKDLVISSARLMKRAKILCSFYIRLQHVNGEFVATSGISDLFESGETGEEAVRNYLYSLVDEIIWLQENREKLSDSMHKDLCKLQTYISLL